MDATGRFRPAVVEWPERLHVGADEAAAESRLFQGVREVAFFSRVTQPREFHARSLRTQQAQEPADAGRASERDDGDTRFHVCVTGPEAELIRALGANAVQEVIDALGDLRAFRILQKQPAQRERSVEQQLRRFMGTISGRKSHYARSLVDDLDLAHVPRPLNRLPAHPYR